MDGFGMGGEVWKGRTGGARSGLASLGAAWQEWRGSVRTDVLGRRGEDGLGAVW
jgi:hypothetical protein